MQEFSVKQIVKKSVKERGGGGRPEPPDPPPAAPLDKYSKVQWYPRGRERE